LKKEDNKMYQLAKARVLMLGYGAGWNKFRDTAYKMLGLRIEDKVARDTVRDFRAKNPLLKGFWKARDIEITEAGRQKPPANVYVYKMKSGRCLVYNNVVTKMCMVEVPDYEKDPEGLTMKTVLMPQSTAVVNGFQTRHFYGGKITENIVQATARDIFAEGLRRCYQKGWHVPFHVHDEVILDVPKSVAIEEAIEALSFCPDWAEGCPVDIEAQEADHYLK
jgi:DNA polymerase